ncbi:MAG: hypothetical protein ACJAS1_000298, partial [Oleiphilaceae bacterium]
GNQAHPLRYRPAHYVPIQVPIYDEVATQLQNDANGNGETEPLYRWVYRPELQLSQYSFDAKSLIVKQIDDNGTESETSIDISQDEADFGPVFDEYTDSVELLFDLLGPTLGDELLNTLPPLENDREFVLSLGGEEALATIGADGKVIFNNPDHLALLKEEDLLSLRLYLNGDAGNVLWEYHMAGFGPFWSIYPNQQPSAIRKPNSPINASAASVSAADGGSYYMLGGMRIKVLFQTEQSSTLGEALSVTWKVEDSSGSLLSNNIGNFYPDNNPVSDSLGKSFSISSTLNPDAALFETYYQPEQWRTDLDVKITAQVRYNKRSTPKNYSISLKSRELYPVSTDNPNIYNPENSQAPLEGSDVAMLEDLLWQLGNTASFATSKYKNYGYLSRRIPEGRRDTFDVECPSIYRACREAGTPIAVTESNRYDTSMARLIWGFKNASELDGQYDDAQRNDFTPEDLTIDINDLSVLKEQWKDYLEATWALDSSPDVNHDHSLDNTNIYNDNNEETSKDWASHAVQQWNRTFSAGVLTNLRELTNNNTITREALIEGWARKENGFGHWGGTEGAYRIITGGADSKMSFGFSQIQSRYAYGLTSNGCDELRDLNMMHPRNNLAGFAVWSAYQGCGESFFLAFSTARPYDEYYDNSQTIQLLRARYGNNEQALLLQADNNVNNFSETNYERLTKGIAGYNQGLSTNYWSNESLASTLRGLNQINHSAANEITKCSNYPDNSNDQRRCIGYLYAIDVKQRANIPLASYLWRTTETVEIGGIPQQANVCFWYGEAEWEEHSWETVRDQAIADNNYTCPVASAP